MSNDYYNESGSPSTGSAGTSSTMRSEFSSIGDGFDKLPGLTGNGLKIVAVNAGGSALEAITTTGTGDGVRATNPSLTTPSLGVATATSINGLGITSTTGTFTLSNGKTLTVTGTMTLTATDGATLAIGAGGTLGTMAYETAANYLTAALAAPKANPTFTGTVTIPTPWTLGAVSVTATGTEMNYLVGVTSAIQTQINAKAPIDNATLTGYTRTTSLQEKKVAVSASEVDILLGNVFTKTISGTTTFTVANVPTTGTVASFILELTNAGAHTVNWWTGMTWADGVAPTLTAAGRDVLGFYTHDGGTTWTGMLLAQDAS